VKRTGTGKKGDPFKHQNAGTQVPDMDRVPGNQNTKNDVHDEQQSSNAGTGPFYPEQITETREPAFSTDREEFEV
jgi:hypothetical protein